jgi:hypothetical protein
VLPAIAVPLAGVAVWIWRGCPARWRLPEPGWEGTEQAGWLAGIAGAVFGLGALAIAVLDRRDSRRQARTPSPAPESSRVVRVGLVPREAGWFQNRGVVHELVRAAKAGRGVVLTQVLSGLGGVGKTQLAAQFARHLDAAGDLDVLVWITAADRQALLAGYAAAARALHLPGIDAEPDSQVAAERLLNWLSDTDLRWLIVLDDLGAPGDAAGLWPPDNPHGRTLITTRRRDQVLNSGNRVMIAVGLFSREEAAAYLSAATGTGSPPADIDALATMLGRLPLAVVQAASYIRDRGIDCAAYLDLLRRHGLTRVMQPEDALPDDHRATVATTWTLSMETADQHAPRGLARPLLKIAALLDANGIPATVFTTDAVRELLTGDGDGPPDDRAIDDALGNLHRLHLISLDRANGILRVHALVQHATREQLTVEQLASAARTAAEALIQIWPEIDRDPALTQMLYANATALTDIAGDALLTPGAHRLLHRAARSLGMFGEPRIASAAFERLLTRCLRVLGPDHPDTLVTRRDLAVWRGAADDAAGAAEALARLIPDFLRILGPDHPDTLRAREDLAGWRGEAGDPAGAAEALQELLSDLVRVLGPDRLETLRGRNDLAHFTGKAGNPAGAAAAFQQLLTDELRILGPDHPVVLITRRSLARWCGEAGDPAGAVAALEQLVPQFEQTYGPEHSPTLQTRNHLAQFLGEAGDPGGAVTAFERLLTDQLRILGPDHPDTRRTRGKIVYWRGRLTG